MTISQQHLLPPDGGTAATPPTPSYGTTDASRTTYFDVPPKEPPPTLSLQIPEPRSAGTPPDDDEYNSEEEEELEGENIEESEDNAGVHKAEATQEVFERSSKKLLLLGIGLACYIHSLDSTSLYTFPTFAASSFHAHGLLGAIGVAQAVVLAIGKPIIAKLADASSRGTAFLFVICLYALGYIVCAGAQSIQMLIGGIVLYSVAQSSLQLLNQILIADYSTLRTRGLFSALATAPFLLNAPIGAWIGATVIQTIGWRSGYLVFALLVPACLFPLLATLLWAERRVSTLVLAPSSAPVSAISPEDQGGVRRMSSSHVRGSSSSPLIPVGSHSRRRSSRVSTHSTTRPRTRWTRVLRLAEKLDLVGLSLLAASIALILVPLALSRPVEHAPPAAPPTPGPSPTPGETPSGENPATENMSRALAKRWAGDLVGRAVENLTDGGWTTNAPLLLLGVMLLGAFVVWDGKYATSPVVPRRFWTNRAVLVAAVIGLFDFASFYLTFTYLFSYVVVSRPWSMAGANTFVQVQGFSMTIFAISAGGVMRRIRRYKPVLLGGVIIRLIGVVAMIPARGRSAPAFLLVITQVLQGVGGGAAFISAQVGAQASVAPRDVAVATAVVLLLAELGNALGGAGAGMLWVRLMPSALERYLPDVPEKVREELFGSISEAAKYPFGDPIREGVIGAYDEVMKQMLAAAALVAVVPVLLAMAMPDYVLSDKRASVLAADEGEVSRRNSLRESWRESAVWGRGASQER